MALLLPKELSIYPSINYNMYEYRNIDQTRYGFGLRGKKLMDKKLMLNLGGQLFINQYNGPKRWHFIQYF